MGITAIVHTKNSASTLGRLLESISWMDERIVVDMESTDSTCEIAQAGGAKLLSVKTADRVDGVRNEFLEQGSEDWVFVLDSDEYLADDAKVAVSELLSTNGERFDAFAIPRYNSIAGHVMRGSGWYPDRQIRLFKKGAVRWSDSTHEAPKVVTGEEKLCRLDPPGCLHIHHDNYSSVSEFIERQVRYALLDQYPEGERPFREYVREAYEEFQRRDDAESDGELAFALATIMAWDKVIRGLIHWEKTGRKDSLERAFSLPVVTAEGGGFGFPGELDALRKENAELLSQLRAVEEGVLWKASHALETRLPGVKRAVKSILGKGN